MVLAFILSQETWLSGKAIANATGLTCKQTADALTILFNQALIARQGNKFTAKWAKPALVPKQDNQEAVSILSTAFLRSYK